MGSRHRGWVHGRLMDGCPSRIFICHPRQEHIQVEGQQVKLPFTNMKMEVLVVRINGRWEYLDRQRFDIYNKRHRWVENPPQL